VLWAGMAGVAIGALLGTCIGRLVVYLRAAHREALGLDEFLTVELIGISYGAALLCHAYGVLAVFAAGLAMRRIKADRSSDRTAEPVRTPKHRRRILTSGTGARRSSHGTRGAPFQ
jgi:NhaP-type Na+/H+ or K+/H+ antiporter